MLDGCIERLFGLARSTITEIVGKFTSQVSDIQDEFYERGKSVEELAKFNIESVKLAWGGHRMGSWKRFFGC